MINKLVDLDDLKDKKYQFYIDALNLMRGEYCSTGIPFYDKLCGDFRLWEYSHLLVNTVDVFNCQDQHVLDAGCCSSVFLGLLSTIYGKVGGIDKNEEEIKTIRSIMAKLHFRNVDCCVGDVSSMSQFVDEMFDRIYSVCVIEHLKDPFQLRALKEWSRILKQGGLLAFTFDFGTLKSENGFADREDIEDRLIKPLIDSGLRLLGNREFDDSKIDRGINKKFFTFGSLFFEKK